MSQINSNSVSFQLTALNKMPDVVPSGFYECRIIFKLSDEEKKAGKEKRESVGCFLPSVSDSFASTFASLHPSLIATFLEETQSKIARSVVTKFGRSPCSSDFSVESLASFLTESISSESRLTSDSVKSALNSQLGLDFINFLADSRGINIENADNVAMLTQIKNNYLNYFLFAVSRKPAFETGAVKEKVVSVFAAFGDWLAAENKEVSPIFLKALEVAIDAPVKAFDVNAL